ncbi:Uncharacterised protein [uncultured archaeon]|nr:Uncharacterised protein [uncultured archaeon]
MFIFQITKTKSSYELAFDTAITNAKSSKDLVQLALDYATQKTAVEKDASLTQNEKAIIQASLLSSYKQAVTDVRNLVAAASGSNQQAATTSYSSVTSSYTACAIQTITADKMADLDYQTTVVKTFSNWKNPDLLKTAGQKIKDDLLELSRQTLTKDQKAWVDATILDLQTMLKGITAPASGSMADWGTAIDAYINNVSLTLVTIGDAEKGLAAAYATFKPWLAADLKTKVISPLSTSSSNAEIEFAISMIYGSDFSKYETFVPGFTYDATATLKTNYIALLNAMNKQAAVDNFQTLHDQAKAKNPGLFLTTPSTIQSLLSSHQISVLAAFNALDMVANDNIGEKWMASQTLSSAQWTPVLTFFTHWDAFQTALATEMKSATPNYTTLKATLQGLITEVNNFQTMFTGSGATDPKNDLLNALLSLQTTLNSPSSATFASDAVSNVAKVNLQIQAYKNGVSGFNPSSTILTYASTADLTVSGQFGLFGADPRKTYGQIYPDISPAFASERETVLTNYLSYYSQVSSASSFADRDANLAIYTSELAKDGLMQTNAVSRFTDQTFTVNEGNISINPYGVTGVTPIGAVQNNPLADFARNILDPQFRTFDYITVPTIAFQKYRSSTPSVLTSASTLVHTKSKVNSIWASKIIVASVGDEYHIDPTLTLQKLSGAYKKATANIPKSKLRAGEFSLDAGEVKPQLDEFGVTAGTKMTGGNKYVDNELVYGKQKGDDLTASQFTMLSDVKNAGAIKTEVTKAILTSVATSNYKQVSQDIASDLNAMYGDSDIVFHYDRRRDAATSGSDFLDIYKDYAHAYWRISGTTWVEVYLNDDVQKQLTTLVDNDNALNNVFLGGGSYDWKVASKGGFQNLDINLQDNIMGTQQKASLQGFFLGIGSSELSNALKLAAVGGKTVTDDIAAGIMWDKGKVNYSLRYYSIDADKLFSYLTGANVGGTVTGRPTLAAVDQYLTATASDNINFAQVAATGSLSSSTVFKAVSLFSWGADRGIYGLNLAKDTENKALLRGYGFFAWEDVMGSSKVTAGLYGFEGDIRPIDMQYITQYNENPDMKMFNLQLSKKMGSYTMQVYATVTDPTIFKTWWAQFEDPTAYSQGLNDAISQYNTAITGTSKEAINSAIEGINAQLNTIFTASDSYNAFLQSGLVDISIKMVSDDKDKPAFHIGGASIVDESGTQKFRTSAYITTGKHLGIALFADQPKLSEGVGGGITWVEPKWSVAGIVESTTKSGVQTTIAQTSIAYTPSETRGYMASFAAGKHFWKAKFFAEGPSISTMISGSKTDDVYSVGMKSLLLVNKAKDLYVFGGVGRDFKSTTPTIPRMNYELGIEQYPLSSSYNWAVGVRMDNLLKRNQFMLFLNLTKTF